MKTVFRLCLLFAVLSGSACARDIDAVRDADARRLAATIAGDVAQLSELLSSDLHYAHSDGRAQTKEQFLAAVRENKVKYLSVRPEDVKFQTIAPGAVAMNGRAQIDAEAGGRRVTFALRFLAIWREEAGAWRLLAYQSSQPLTSPSTEATP